MQLQPRPFPLDVHALKAYKVVVRGTTRNAKGGSRVTYRTYTEENLLNIQWTIPGIRPASEELQRFYNMQQGSPEWLAGRHRFLTSTVILVIVCVSSFNGPTDFWRWIMREHASIKFTDESLRIMGHGTFHEDPVRVKFNKLAGTAFREVGTIVYKQMPGLACNVDGLIFDNAGKISRICEIKCPVFQPYKEVVVNGRPPISHFAQCQINMNITDCEEIYYIMCHIPNAEMEPRAFESCKRGYYYRYLQKQQNASLPPEEALAMPLAAIPKIGLLYCISIKRSRTFWNYLTAHIRRFWNMNVIKFQPPVEDASTGKRDYSWFIENQILGEAELAALFTPVYVELAVNLEEEK